MFPVLVCWESVREGKGRSRDGRLAGLGSGGCLRDVLNGGWVTRVTTME